MKKTITITSRGEAQRLLVSGEVKELRSYGNAFVFREEHGIVELEEPPTSVRMTMMLRGPWTYSIEVPDETRCVPLKCLKEFIAAWEASMTEKAL